MAKTPSKLRKRSRKTQTRSSAVGRQARLGVWTPEDLRKAIETPSRREKLALIQRVGIVDERGKLTRKYRSWGSKVSRTQ